MTIESDITKSEVRFKLPIDVNVNVTIAEIVKAVNQSKSSVDRIISGLKKTGRLIRVGSPRRGKWEVR